LNVKIPEFGDLLMEMYLFCRSYPLARPRLNKNRSTVYQPLNNQAEARDLMLSYRPDEPISVPVCLSARLFFTGKAYKTNPYVTKYDADNLLKGVGDNLQYCGIISDDRIILRADVSKAWAPEDFMIIRIFEVKYGIESVPGGVSGRDTLFY